MKVTVTLGSKRPGGVEVALAGLANQSYDDFEVIFVDERYHIRHDQVQKAVKASGLKQSFMHVPNHRYGDTRWGTVCAGYNTGFALAEGQIVIQLMDYALAPRHWISQHVRVHEMGNVVKTVMAPHDYRMIEPGDFGVRKGAKLKCFSEPEGGEDIRRVTARGTVDEIEAQRQLFDGWGEISTFRKGFDGVAELAQRDPVLPGDPKLRMVTGPSRWNFLNTKNESYVRDKLFAVNGMDEFYDLGCGPGDLDLALRLENAGAVPWVCAEATVTAWDVRFYLPNLTVTVPQSARGGSGVESRFCFDEGLKDFESRDPKRVRANNPQTLEELRDEIWDWRELSQEGLPVIQKRITSDKEYWGNRRAR